MPLADHEVRDPRTKRTRRLLQDALRSLLQEKPLDEILIHEIAETATVNRATFYDHYAGKPELFNALIAADFEHLLQQRQITFDGTCTSGLGPIVLAVGDYLLQLHRDHAACTRASASGPFIDAAITLAIQRIIQNGLEQQNRTPNLPIPVAASLTAGAIYAAVRDWLARANWQLDESALLTLVPILLPVLELAAPSSPPRTTPRPAPTHS